MTQPLTVKTAARYDTWWQAGYIDDAGDLQPMDLTGLTVTLEARKSNLSAPVIPLACTVPDPTNGRILHRLTGTLTEGSYFVQAWGLEGDAPLALLPFPSDSFASLVVING